MAKYEEASRLGRNVKTPSHAEMDSRIQHQKTDSSWDDITQDFTADDKSWTETSTAQSNEWASMKAYQFTDARRFPGWIQSALHAADYLNAAVTLAKTDATYHESAKEMIEKMLDAVGFHGALNLLNRAWAITPLRERPAPAQQSAELYHRCRAHHRRRLPPVLGRAQARCRVRHHGQWRTRREDVRENRQILVIRQEEKNWRQVATVLLTAGIEKQLRIVYSQCVVKYAYKTPHWRRVPHLRTARRPIRGSSDVLRHRRATPSLKGANDGRIDAATQFFDTLFDVRATPSRGSWDFANYCKAIENLKGIFSISDSDFGHYHKVYHAHCESKKVYDSSLPAKQHEVRAARTPACRRLKLAPPIAPAAISFVIAVAGVVVGSIALHKVRKTGTTKFSRTQTLSQRLETETEDHTYFLKRNHNKVIHRTRLHLTISHRVVRAPMDEPGSASQTWRRT